MVAAAVSASRVLVISPGLVAARSSANATTSSARAMVTPSAEIIAAWNTVTGSNATVASIHAWLGMRRTARVSNPTTASRFPIRPR